MSQLVRNFCVVAALLLVAGAAQAQERASPLDPDRVDFVMGNFQFTLLHELAHAAIWDVKPPIIGPEESAADYLATDRSAAAPGISSRRCRQMVGIRDDGGRRVRDLLAARRESRRLLAVLGQPCALDSTVLLHRMPDLWERSGAIRKGAGAHPNAGAARRQLRGRIRARTSRRWIGYWASLPASGTARPAPRCRCATRRRALARACI